MLENLSVIEKITLVDEVSKLKNKGYRFAAMTCEQEGETYEFTYHFDMDFNMKHLRVNAGSEDIIPSISSVFPAAFLIENEVQDLYGFKFDGLLIDYKGRLFLAEDGPVAPMKKDEK